MVSSLRLGAPAVQRGGHGPSHAACPRPLGPCTPAPDQTARARSTAIIASGGGVRRITLLAFCHFQPLPNYTPPQCRPESNPNMATTPPHPRYPALCRFLAGCWLLAGWTVTAFNAFSNASRDACQDSIAIPRDGFPMLHPCPRAITVPARSSKHLAAHPHMLTLVKVPGFGKFCKAQVPARPGRIICTKCTTWFADARLW